MYKSVSRDKTQHIFTSLSTLQVNRAPQYQTECIRFITREVIFYIITLLQTVVNRNMFCLLK